MGAGGFPIDLLLFGMIAAFLVLRLRSILGRRDGLEPAPGPARAANRPAGPVIDAVAEPAVVPGRKLPDANSAAGQALVQMQRLDPKFDPQRFLNGAEAAFRLIVTEFAAGNRDALRPLLSPDTYGVFDAAITQRQAAGEVLTSEIRGVQEAEIIAANLQGSVADMTVRFVSDQISKTLDRDGRYVAGTDAVTELRDEWSFSRDLATGDPVWRLTQARSA